MVKKTYLFFLSFALFNTIIIAQQDEDEPLVLEESLNDEYSFDDFEIDESLFEVTDEEITLDEEELKLEGLEITATIPIPIPFFGTLELEGIFDIEKERYALKKVFDPPALGPLFFDPVTFELSNKDGLQASGGVTIAQTHAALKLDHLKSVEGSLDALFSLTFEKSLDVPLSPWKKLPFKRLELHLSREEKKLSTLTTLSEKDDVSFSFTLEQSNIWATLSINSFRLSTLIPALEKTPGHKIIFKDIKVRIKNPFLKKGLTTPTTQTTITTGTQTTMPVTSTHTTPLEPKQITYLEGTVDLSEIDLKFALEKKDITMTATIDPVNGFYMEAALPDITLPPVGSIRDAKLIISHKIEPELTEGGIGSIKRERDTRFDTTRESLTLAEQKKLEREMRYRDPSQEQSEKNSDVTKKDAKNETTTEQKSSDKKNDKKKKNPTTSAQQDQNDQQSTKSTPKKSNNTATKPKTNSTTDNDNKTSVPRNSTTQISREHTQQKLFQISITGKAVLDVPFGIGKLETLVKAKLSKRGFSFTAELDKEFAFEGVAFKNPRLLVSTEGVIELQGDAHILDFDVTAHLKMAKVKGKNIVSFYGTVKKGEEGIKPFENVPGIKEIKEFRTLSINNIKIGMASDKTFFFSGTTKIMKVSVHAMVKKIPTGVAVIGQTGSDFSISQLIPGAKGTIIEKLGASNISLVISSADYYDTDLKTNIKKGFSLIAKVSLKESEELESFDRFLGGVEQDLMLIGTIGTSLADSYFTIAIPLSIPLSPVTSLQNIKLEIGGTPPSVAGLAQLSVQPTPDELLLITARIQADPGQVKVAGTMQGDWHNPLGIKDITLSNIAAEVGAIYTVAPPLPLFGITGTLRLGRVVVEMALKISPNASDIILLGKISQLSLEDIIKILDQKATIKNLPEIGIENVEVKIAPKRGQIGEIIFEPGLTLKGTLHVLDFMALVNFTIGAEGIVAQGAMSEIEIGPLKVTGMGFDKKWGTGDDGPVINLSLTLEKQELFISGFVTLLGITQQTELEISKDRVYFKIEGKIDDKFEAFVEAQTKGSLEKGNLDFSVHGYMKNDFIQFLKNQTIKEIEKFQENVKNDLTKAQNDVKKIDNDIATMRQQITKNKQEIKRLEAVIQKKVEKAQSKTAQAQSDVAKKRKELDSLNKEVEKARARIRELGGKPLATHKILYLAHHKKQLPVSFDEQSENSSFLLSDSDDEDDPDDEKKVYRMINTIDLDRYKNTYQTLKVAGIFDDVGNWLEKNIVKPVGKVVEDTGKTAEIVALQSKIVTLNASREIAQAALRAVEDILRETEKVSFDVSSLEETAKITELNLGIAGLDTAITGALASREVAVGTLEAVKQSAVGIADAGKVITKTAGELIDIKKADIKGSLREIVKGKLPTCAIDFILIGREHHLEIDLTFQDIGKMIEKFVDNILRELKLKK